MRGHEKLEELFRLGRLYSSMYERYHTHGVLRTLDNNDKEFSGNEEHYFDVGADAIRLIVSSLIVNLRSVPRSILDFPSGSGRVTRHLKAFFVNSEITACDLYSYHVDFCRDKLGVRGFESKQNFEELDFERKYDLIFCGSLLTHLPEIQFWSAIRLLCRSLSETGVAIVTLHGKYSIYIHHHRWKYMTDDLFSIAESGFASTGFGYVDYDRNVREIFNKQDTYGISLTSPAYLARGLEDDLGVRLLGYYERAWDDHHDVVVIGKPPLNAQ